MASPREQRSGLSDAAGRAALFGARAAARVWRDQLEEAVDVVPVLFDRRRRGFADFLGGTLVLYDHASIANTPPSDQDGRLSIAPAQDRGSA